MEMAKFLSKYIGISHNVLRSFISLAISMWQATENMLVRKMNHLHSDVRFEFVEAIYRHLKSLDILILKDKNQTSDLEKAMNMGRGLYKELRADI